MKPKLRKEVEIDLYSAMQGIIRTHLLNRLEYPFQSCISCINFNEASELCKLANRRPPAQIIVFGCNSYEDVHEVPF